MVVSGAADRLSMLDIEHVLGAMAALACTPNVGYMKDEPSG